MGYPPTVSPSNVRLWVISAEFVRCEHCSAPMVDPLPPHWPVTVVGPHSNARITPHTPDCARLDVRGEARVS
jgi:hypothetical protein